MLKNAGTGPTPFARLRRHLEGTQLRCDACGHVDDGGWEAATSGDRVRYTHTCPQCGRVRVRVVYTDRGGFHSRGPGASHRN